MKVVFLDVDGVLNNSALLYHYGIDYINEDMVDLFAKIIEKTGAEVVLSSSWRLQKKHTKIVKNALGEKGIEIIGKTPARLSEDRSREISDWLSGRPIDAYAIIDDNPLAGVGHPGCFFQTDAEIGLDQKTANNVIKHLNSIS